MSSLFINLLGLAVPLFVIQVLNRYVAHGIDGTLISLTVGAFIAVGMEFLFREVRIRLAGCASVNINRKLGLKTFAVLLHMRGHALSLLPQRNRHETIQGLETVQNATSAANLTALLDVPFALLYLLTLWLLSVELFIIATGFILGALALGFLGINSTRDASQTLAKEMTNRRALVSSATNTGVDTIRAFDAQKFVMNAWRETYNRIEGLTHFMQNRQGLMQTTTQALTGLMTICIIAVGAKLSVLGELNVGIMMGCNILAARALMPISRLAQFGQQLSKARVSLQQLERFHKMPIELQKGTEIKDFVGDLELIDLTFQYPGNAGPLFEQLSIKLPHGSIVAVVGRNGSGKSTMARVLMGLLDPERGKIMADGVDLRQISPNWWRAHVSYLPQEPNFIEASIRENITIGVPHITEKQLNDLINVCALREYIDNSAQGLDEMIFNQGKDLALGIRRRIALARALATDGKILILDEPTEGLDREGQTAIYNIINFKLSHGYTVIAFSHDPGILKNAHYLIDLNVKPVPRIGMNKQFAETLQGDQPGPDGDAPVGGDDV